MNFYIIPKSAEIVDACLRDAASCISKSDGLSKRALSTALLVLGLACSILNTLVYYPVKTLACFSINLIAWPRVGIKYFIKAKNAFVDWNRSLLLTAQLFQDCLIAPFSQKHIHQIKPNRPGPPLSTLDFSNLYAGFGETKKGCQWKDLPIAIKCMHVFKACMKAALFSAGIGRIAFLVTPPPLSLILAPALATFAALTGLGLIAKSFYNLAIQSPEKTFPNLDTSAPRLGEWSYNNALITKNGSQSLQLKLDLIDKAEHTIVISGSYCGGEIFDKALDRIEKNLAKKEKLQVNILTSPDCLTKSNYQKIRCLAARYYERFACTITPKRPFFLPTYRTIENHAKLFVVDSKVCMTGGTGMQDHLAGEERISNGFDIKKIILGSGARDADVAIEGPLAKTMHNEFCKLFAKWRRLVPNSNKYGSEKYFFTEPRNTSSYLEGLKKSKHVKTAMLAGGVEHGDQHACKQGYLQMIRYAKKDIVIANMNFSEPDILHALYHAALRGVRIKIITNANQSTSSLASKGMGIPNTLFFKKFLEKGVEIYEYKKPGVLYHKKIMVVDNRLTTVGSFNIGSYSAEVADEDIVIMDSKRMAKKTLDNLQEDMLPENSHRAQKEEYTGFFQTFGRMAAARLTLQLTARIFQ